MRYSNKKYSLKGQLRIQIICEKIILKSLKNISKKKDYLVYVIFRVENFDVYSI